VQTDETEVYRRIERNVERWFEIGFADGLEQCRGAQNEFITKLKTEGKNMKIPCTDTLMVLYM